MHAVQFVFFELQTACRSFHEILLLTFPALDKFFRDQELKENLCSLQTMDQWSHQLVAWFRCAPLKLLQLIKISFADYHSKRNFVEGVHAEENKALSKHGPFSADTHLTVTVGSAEHKENMER